MAEEFKASEDTHFEPKNELEFLLQAGREGKVSLATSFQVLLRSPVYMVLDREVKEGEQLGSVQSLMIQNEEGKQMLTVFTHRDRCSHFLGKHPGYDHPTEFPAHLLLDNMQDDMGLVINPGLPLGVQIAPEGVQGLKRDFGRPWLKNIPEPETGQGGDA